MEIDYEHEGHEKKIFLSASFISAAVIALFSLVRCEYFSTLPEDPHPVIIASTRVETTTTTIDIAVGAGFFFSPSAADADFTIGGTYAGTVTVDNDHPATKIYFALSSPPATGDTITIQAKPTAFSPVAGAPSNTVTITVQ